VITIPHLCYPSLVAAHTFLGQHLQMKASFKVGPQTWNCYESGPFLDDFHLGNLLWSDATSSAGNRQIKLFRLSDFQWPVKSCCNRRKHRVETEERDDEACWTRCNSEPLPWGKLSLLLSQLEWELNSTYSTPTFNESKEFVKSKTSQKKEMLI
jgi:hypothetical protein